MTYRSAFLKWLGSAGLVMAMAGCPGGDDGETGAETGPQPPTTGMVTEGSSSGEPPTTNDTTADGESTAAPETTGGVTCDPPCEAGQQCIDGACFDMADTGMTTGEPPMECGLAVMIQTQNPACGPCLEDACCPELQACFGDETTMMETECLQLNNCIVMSCMGVPPAEIQACIDENCADFSASFDLWVAYQACAGMNCAADCS